jgi:hypothetical protein
MSTNLDDIEKLNIIFKEILGFPSTSENLQYYEEVQTNFNTYTLGENVLLENIIQKPDFDISGIARTASELGLLEADFYDYSYNPINKSICSIVDDSTGTIRRFTYLILEETPGTANIDSGASWYKLDNSRNNVVENSIQYNYKAYQDSERNNALTFPYKYEVFTQRSIGQSIIALRTLDFGPQGGNWIYNYKNGILFFSDVNNILQKNANGGIYNINATNNRPIISVYKYIGKKSISNLAQDVDGQIKDLYKQTSIFKENFIKIFTYVQNLSHKITDVKDLFNNNINLNTNYSNKSIFSPTSAFTTTSNGVIDLSNSFFNTISPINDNTNILVTVNAVLYCSYENNNRIKIQVWRDLSMIVDTSNIGSINATNGLVVPYSITYLDENINRNLKKYYLKYQLENSSSINQGIINVRTSQSQQEGSSDILLREIRRTPNYIDFINFSNKLLFNTSSITITNNEFIDLSNIFFNTIRPCNNHFILVNINVSLLCGSAYQDNITVQLWNDTTMLLENKNIGSPAATGEFIFPYNITYLDENYDNSTKKYYLKYKLENGSDSITRTLGGIVNIRTPIVSYGSSNIILQEYRNISYNSYNNKSATYTNVVSKTTSTELVDLSNVIFQTINSCNNSNIIVYINVTLICCKEYNETLTIELWRDNTLIMRDNKLGTQIGRSGFLNMPYNVTYLDEKVSNGPKKYYLKYKHDNNISSVSEYGIIDIKTSQIFGSPNILLNEITNSLAISNKQFFDVSYSITKTADLMDLSNSFFNTISLANQANVMVNINVSLLCGYANKEKITIELWRDSTMLTRDIDLGTKIAAGGFIFPYNLTYLDTNVNSGIIKYYLKYKVSRDTNNPIINYGDAGLVNIRTLENSYGSSCFFLRQT